MSKRIIICLLFLLCACAPAQTQADTLQVVATTTMLQDLLGVIGDGEVEVIGLMGEGVDPHLYQAGACDVEKLRSADAVLYNGFHLEGKMGEIFASLDTQGKEVICIEDAFDPAQLLQNGQSVDPHIWFDVALWMQAATHLAERLSEIDPQSAKVYAQNLADYLVELEALDAYIHARAEELEPSQRVLVTAHDAFGYFGAAYGFEVRGLQGINTDAQAGTGDVSALATYLEEHRIKAIFVESSVPTKSIEALQQAVQGFSVAIGGQLYSDALGDASDGLDNYISTFTSNIDTIVEALQ